MPGRDLPTLPQADVQSKDNSKECYVTLGTKVYDITSFLDDHPGGGDLILEYGGKDVTNVMQDEMSHAHSESAYEILDDCLIGFVADDSVMDIVTKSNRPDSIVPLLPNEEGMQEVKANGTTNGAAEQALYNATGMSAAEDLSKDTDSNADFKTHKFLDLSKPLLMQVWNGGFSKQFYLQQVHRPRHYKGGASAPLFGNFLEPLSLTPWWVVPTLWWPCIAYGSYVAYQGLSPNVWQLPMYWAVGLCIWTIVEYGLHRCLFHLDEYVSAS